MPLKYILDQFCNKIGLDPAQETQRSVALRFINEGAKELYDESDMAGSLMEALFKINGDQTVAFPSYFGDLRAARPFDTQVPIHITQMRPRYNVVNWPEMWRNYRIKNKHALHTSVRNQSVFTVTVHAVENPPVEVTIVGSSDYSDRISETLVMDSVTKTTTNTFNDVVSFTKNRYNGYNVVLTDVDGLEMAVIPNNQLQSEYLHIDVSSLPWANNDGGSIQAHWVEVLYKKRLALLSVDSDEFPAMGYDEVVVNKALQLYYQETEKTDLAIAYDQKATRTLGRIHNNENRATEDVIALVPNPHDSLQYHIRPYRPGWFPNLPNV